MTNLTDRIVLVSVIAVACVAVIAAATTMGPELVRYLRIRRM